MSRRRRGNDDAVVTIYWRDIPAQVTAGPRTEGEKVLLHPRFQNAIDRAAAVAGTTDATSYVAQWRRVAEPLDGVDPAGAARAKASKLEADHPPSVLQQLVRSGGWCRSAANDPDTANGPDAAKFQAAANDPEPANNQTTEEGSVRP